MKANLDRLGVPLSEIRYGLATHYHMDHAGHAQELKQAGIKLVVMETQVEWIARMKDHIKPTDNYLDLTVDDNRVINFAESRALLRELSLAGEIFPTPGHSPDSVSLLLDDGSAFTGDRTRPALVTEETAEEVAASWQLLRDHGASRIYPAHGSIRAFGEIG